MQSQLVKSYLQNPPHHLQAGPLPSFTGISDQNTANRSRFIPQINVIQFDVAHDSSICGVHHFINLPDGRVFLRTS